MKKKILCLVLTGVMALGAFAGCSKGGSSDKKIGVSMPTKDLQRWNQDGANMEEQLKAAGYEVDLQYASNEVATQVSHRTRSPFRSRRGAGGSALVSRRVELRTSPL